MVRRYRLRDGDTPQSVAAMGKGDARELWQSNRTWMSADFLPWNEGQQVTVPIQDAQQWMFEGELLFRKV